MSEQQAATLQGLRVLVVEDEALVSMLLEDMLSDHGCEIVATASRIGQALELIADDALVLDAAILDVNLGGEPIFPVAEALTARGCPFVFATGYGAGGLPEAWRSRPTLQKPFSHDDVGRALAVAVNGG
ncbi:MAG TPA: response regulator [Caulobacteraceae bacterium]|jgi:CheY-like chemotaxis protein|nr:response regulator [Caulobacteraceae bacterium]